MRVLAVVSLAACAAVGAPGAVDGRFDFEALEPTTSGTGIGSTGSILELELEDSGIGMTIFRAGDAPFDIVDSANIGNGGVFPPSWGNRALSGFAEIDVQSARFLFSFDSSASSFSIDCGNGGSGEGEGTRVFLLEAFDAENPGQIVATDQVSLGDGPIGILLSARLKIQGHFDLVRLSAGSSVPGFPTHFNNVYLDNMSVTVALPCSAADLADPRGILDLSDVSFFTGGFIAGDFDVDVNADGFLDLADITLFIDAFLKGCP